MHHETASRWVGIYSELLGFTENLLDLLRPPAGASSRPDRPLAPDLAMIGQHVQHYRNRLEFWQVRALPGASLEATTVPQHAFRHSVAPRILGTREAARELGVSTTYVRRLLTTGRLEGIRMGSAWIVDSSSVAALRRELNSSDRRR